MLFKFCNTSEIQSEICNLLHIRDINQKIMSMLQIMLYKINIWQWIIYLTYHVIWYWKEDAWTNEK